MKNLAAELVRLEVDIIVAVPTPAAVVAKNSTETQHEDGKGARPHDLAVTVASRGRGDSVVDQKAIIIAALTQTLSPRWRSPTPMTGLGHRGPRDMGSNIRSRQLFGRCSKDRSWPRVAVRERLKATRTRYSRQMRISC